MMIGRARRGAADRVRRPRLPRRLRLEGVPAPAGPCAAIPLPDGLRESDRLPEPVFTPAWKAPQGQHDENIPSTRVVELVGDRPRGGAAATLSHPPVRARRRGLRAGGDHPRRHEVRVRRAARRRADPHRRGHDARQLALLERRRLPARPAAGELRQAVRPRLARDASRGPKTAPGPGAAGRRRRTAPAAATSRPTNESPGRASPAISRRT